MILRTLKSVANAVIGISTNVENIADIGVVGTDRLLTSTVDWSVDQSVAREQRIAKMSATNQKLFKDQEQAIRQRLLANKLV